jgi:hypothetical protein
MRYAVRNTDRVPANSYLGRMRLPASRTRAERGANALDYEILQEQAAALGRLGRALEAALAALSEYDKAVAARPENFAGPISPATGTREQLVQRASDALWCFVVQREACGLRDPRPIVCDYRVPREVYNRMGAIGGRRRAGPRTIHDP